MQLTLFEECIQNLGSKATVLSAVDSEKIELSLQDKFPFICSNIDWSKNKKHHVINSEDFGHIIHVLEELLNGSINDKSVYAIWDSNYPCIRTDLDTAIAHLDDITSVGTRTWLFNPYAGYIVEWQWCGNKTIGVI